jgi:hypothetical protein
MLEFFQIITPIKSTTRGQPQKRWSWIHPWFSLDQFQLWLGLAKCSTVICLVLAPPFWSPGVPGQSKTVKRPRQKARQLSLYNTWAPIHKKWRVAQQFIKRVIGQFWWEIQHQIRKGPLLSSCCHSSFSKVSTIMVLFVINM